jgi:hypothetical protein
MKMLNAEYHAETNCFAPSRIEVLAAKIAGLKERARIRSLDERTDPEAIDESDTMFAEAFRLEQAIARETPSRPGDAIAMLLAIAEYAAGRNFDETIIADTHASIIRWLKGLNGTDAMASVAPACHMQKRGIDAVTRQHSM